MDAFEAIGDPTRRRLIELLSEGERQAGDLASHFDVSFSAISQQLRILTEAGVVTSRREGRQRLYRIENKGLDPVAGWVAVHARKFWERKLHKLGGVLERMKKHGT
jgi:DNA-binding transcriptional ArsR family regulator